jgi:hypothetical protein
VAVSPDESAAETARLLRQDKGVASLLPPPPPPVDRRDLPPVVSRAAPAPEMPKEAPAPAASPLPPIDTNIPVELTKKPEPTTALAEQQKREQHYREMGINPNMYKDLISVQEEKRKKLPSKDEALGYALMQAGFGLMGARQGQEWQTLGKEAQGALTSYQGALKDIRTSEEKIDEAKQALVLAENQYKKTGADADLAKVESRQEKIDALTAQDVKAKNEAAIKSKELANHIYGYDRAAAAQELGSLRHLEGTKYHANTMAAAQRWVHQQTPSEIRAVNEVFSRMKELNPNATWLDAWNSRAGQNKTGILSDEDLFRSWDKRFSEGKKLTASKEEKEFAKNYPTWQSYANSMRAQVGGPPPAAIDTGGWGKMSVSGQ